MFVIKNGKVLDAIHREPQYVDIRVENGKITEIGPNLIADGGRRDRRGGLTVMPGFVEAHGHIGLDGWGIGFEGQDYNEYGDILTPHLRAIDGIQPRDYALKEAREAGVTCLNVGPGSSNVLGGTFCAIKPAGVRVDNMIVKKETAMKCAFGENPKRCYRDKGNSSRMSTAAKLREMLFKAREYARKAGRGEGRSVQKARVRHEAAGAFAGHPRRAAAEGARASGGRPVHGASHRARVRREDHP